MGKDYQTYDPGKTFPGTWDGSGKAPANVQKSVKAAVKYARDCGMVRGNGQKGGKDADGNEHPATTLPNLLRRHVPGAAEAFSGKGTRGRIRSITGTPAKGKAAKDDAPAIPAHVAEALKGLKPEQVAAMAQALKDAAK